MSNQEPKTKEASGLDNSETDTSVKYAVEFMKGLSMQRDIPEFCDVTVVIDGQEFKCHRIVLSASSGFFNALLSSGMKEDLERKVDLKEISIETFTEILDCIYKAKNIITEKNVFDVWHAANQLQILTLLHDCETFVKDNISIDNCFAIYQTSKLLDSEEMIDYSWSYILREFDSVRRSEEILMLTASEMKQMVASQDLVTKSEDKVVETLLKWAAYKPDENTAESDSVPRTDTTETNNNQISVSEGSDNPGEDQACLKQQHNEELSRQQAQQQQHGQVTDGSAREDEKHVLSRAEHLPDLLDASRLCLLSGQCLMETVWVNPLVQASQKALDLVQKAIKYQLQPDQRQNRCPSSALLRASSKLENVLLAIQPNLDQSSLVCRKQNGKWCSTANCGSYFIAYSAVCFDDNVYIGLDSGSTIVYMPSTAQWKTIPQLSLSARVEAMESIGNFLYAIYRDNDRYSIDMINIKDTLYSQIQGKWSKVGTLSTTEVNISCTTTVDDKIIFFGYHTGKEDTIVECFDTSVQSSSRLNDMPKPSVGMVSFKKDNEAFVIQKSGTLWRIKSCPTPPFVEIKHETLLWDFYRDLKGAVLFNDELLLLGPSVSSSQTDERWELAVPGVFKRVKNITCNENYRCFMHVVLPKVS